MIPRFITLSKLITRVDSCPFTKRVPSDLLSTQRTLEEPLENLICSLSIQNKCWYFWGEWFPLRTDSLLSPWFLLWSSKESRVDSFLLGWLPAGAERQLQSLSLWPPLKDTDPCSYSNRKKQQDIDEKTDNVSRFKRFCISTFNWYLMGIV